MGRVFGREDLPRAIDAYFFDGVTSDRLAIPLSCYVAVALKEADARSFSFLHARIYRRVVARPFPVVADLHPGDGWRICGRTDDKASSRRSRCNVFVLEGTPYARIPGWVTSWRAEHFGAILPKVGFRSEADVSSRTACRAIRGLGAMAWCNRWQTPATALSVAKVRYRRRAGMLDTTLGSSIRL